jgi:hypothetical protein
MPRRYTCRARRSAELSGPLGDGDRRLADLAHDLAQICQHLRKCHPEQVALGARLDLNRQVPAGDGLGGLRHLPQVRADRSEAASDLADLVGAAGPAAARGADVVVDVAMTSCARTVGTRVWTSSVMLAEAAEARWLTRLERSSRAAEAA